MHKDAERLSDRRKANDVHPKFLGAELLETFKHAQQACLDFFGQHLPCHAAKELANATAQKPCKHHAKAHKNPNRRPHERPLFRIVNKEQGAHAKSKQRDKEKSKQAVKHRRRKASTNCILPALHADIVNFLDITADVSRHEVVEEEPHVIKLEEPAVLEANALLFEQELPLKASCKVRNREAKECEHKRENAVFLEQVIEVANIPFRVAHNVTIDKVSRNKRYHQFQTKNKYRFYLRIQLHFRTPPSTVRCNNSRVSRAEFSQLNVSA